VEARVREGWPDAGRAAAPLPPPDTAAADGGAGGGDGGGVAGLVRNLKGWSPVRVLDGANRLKDGLRDTEEKLERGLRDTEEKIETLVQAFIRCDGALSLPLLSVCSPLLSSLLVFLTSSSIAIWGDVRLLGAQIETLEKTAASFSDALARMNTWAHTHQGCNSGSHAC
jgi:hypothetical protein